MTLFFVRIPEFPNPEVVFFPLSCKTKPPVCGARADSVFLELWGSWDSHCWEYVGLEEGLRPRMDTRRLGTRDCGVRGWFNGCLGKVRTPPELPIKTSLPDPGTRVFGPPQLLHLSLFLGLSSSRFLRVRGTPSWAVRVRFMNAVFSRMKTKETSSECRPRVVMPTPCAAASGHLVCFQPDWRKWVILDSRTFLRTVHPASGRHFVCLFIYFW